MKLSKPLTEYTVSSLVSLANREDCDTATKSAILSELRRRHQKATTNREAIRRSKDAHREIEIALQYEGDKAKAEARRKKANAELYNAFKAEAFPLIEIPTGLSPRDTARAFRSALNAKAQEMYSAYRKDEKGKFGRRRDGNKSRLELLKEKHQHEARANKIATATYRHARFPILGASVYYTDLQAREPLVGTLRGYSYRPDLCAFMARIEGADGEPVVRAFSALTPVENEEFFKSTLLPFFEFERCEKIVRERDDLRLRIKVYEQKLTELEPIVEAYMTSDFRKEWLASDDAARELANEARAAYMGKLF